MPVTNPLISGRNLTPTSTEVASVDDAVAGLAEKGQIVQGQVRGPAVENDQDAGAAIALPATSAALTDAV